MPSMGELESIERVGELMTLNVLYFTLFKSLVKVEQTYTGESYFTHGQMKPITKTAVV